MESVYALFFGGSIVVTHNGSQRKYQFMELGECVKSSSTGVFWEKVISNSVCNNAPISWILNDF